MIAACDPLYFAIRAKCGAMIFCSKLLFKKITGSQSELKLRLGFLLLFFSLKIAQLVPNDEMHLNCNNINESKYILMNANSVITVDCIRIRTRRAQAIFYFIS